MYNAKVMIVEDEIIVAEDLQRRLSNMGYSVSSIALSGTEAISQAAKNKPDVILMDIKLQDDMDGIEAARQIHNRFDTCIIYSTAYSDKDTLQRAKIAEPYGYCVKPYRDEELQANIEMALYKHYMEQHLFEREQWLTVTLLSIADGVIVTDVEGIVMLMNPVAETLTGWKQSKATGRHLEDIFCVTKGNTSKPIENPVNQTIRTKRTVTLASDALLRKKDGSEIPIADSAAPILDKKGNCIGTVLVFRDITWQKQAEQKEQQHQKELAHAARLSSVGKMASELAHELNQPLAAISTSAAASLRMLESDSADTGKIISAMHNTVNASLRAGEIIRRIRNFTRKQGPQRSDVDINHITREAISFIRPEIEQKNIKIILDFTEQLPQVSADAIQIEQVILNLLQNGLEAFADHSDIPPCLTIHTRLMADKNTIEIAVVDTGIGFDQGNTEKLFNSFYTTKKDGLGIGLSISQSIIELHGGHLWAEANDQNGSTFRFTLPVKPKISGENMDI